MKHTKALHRNSCIAPFPHRSLIQNPMNQNVNQMEVPNIKQKRIKRTLDYLAEVVSNLAGKFSFFRGLSFFL
jgi:hypothetical protein